MKPTLFCFLVLIFAISCYSNALSKRKTRFPFQGNLEECDELKGFFEGFSLVFRCDGRLSSINPSSCFKNSNGRLVYSHGYHKPNEDITTTCISDASKLTISLTNKVKFSQKSFWDVKEETKEHSHYITLRCLDENGDYVWSYIDFYKYSYYKKDGKVSCINKFIKN